MHYPSIQHGARTITMNALETREYLWDSSIIAWLFDFDGVIGDTMPSNLGAWIAAFGEHGITITKDDYYPLEGMNPRAIVETLGRRYALPPETYERIAVRKAEVYRLQAGPLRIYPHVESLLAILKLRGKKLALVSGAARHRIEETTPKDLLNLFDLIVAGDDITKPKPDPEPYQRALVEFGIHPHEAIVVENAPLGITSAKAAGIFCVALSTTMDRDVLEHQADIVLTGISELFGMLSS